jgi:hypothetical protein
MILSASEGRRQEAGGRRKNLAILLTQRQDLEAWIKVQTGNTDIEFRGGYGVDPLINDPIIKDLPSSSTVLRSTSIGKTGNNHVSAYDLVRLISMLGWHLHVAIETLGVVEAIGEPVVLSKVGFGDSSWTYVALVKFVDRRLQPAKLRTFAFALRSPTGTGADRDTNLAAAVTEIIRRILTEELA